MTDKHDKLVEMARECGFSLVTNEGYQPTPAKLAAFRDRIVASLCADVEPFWHAVISHRAPIVNKAVRSRDVAEEYAEKCSENYPGVEVIPLVPASTVAALKARVAELEKDAARYRWLRNRIDPREISECFGFRGHNVDEKISLRTDSSIDAALTKGQLAPQPQQEQSN